MMGPVRRQQLEDLAARRRRLEIETSALDSAVCEAVFAAREEGATLGQIALALGVSRPAVVKMRERAIVAGEDGREAIHPADRPYYRTAHRPHSTR